MLANDFLLLGLVYWYCSILYLHHVRGSIGSCGQRVFFWRGRRCKEVVDVLVHCNFDYVVARLALATTLG
jgi:hypothetical protein